MSEIDLENCFFFFKPEFKLKFLGLFFLYCEISNIHEHYFQCVYFNGCIFVQGEDNLNPAIKLGTLLVSLHYVNPVYACQCCNVSTLF